MEQLKEDLITSAREKFATILPYDNKESIEDEFTIVGPMLLFWFNTVDNGSHLLSTRI